MRIAHVVTNLRRGGAQQDTLRAIRHAPPQHDVHLICARSEENDTSLMVEARAILGERLHIVPSLVRELRPPTDVRAMLALGAFFRRNRFDIVHTHMSKAGVLGRLSATAVGVPVVIHTAHGWSLWYSRNAFVRTAVRWTERASARFCDAVVVQSEHDAAVGVKEIGIPARKVIHIGKGIHLRSPHVDRASARDRLGIQPDEVLVGIVTRLVRTKRVEDFVRSVPKVRAESPTTRFLVVGSGPDEARLRELARNLGVADVVEFRPTTEDVPVVLDALDVFVHTSAFEGLPSVVLEAMAAGLPVVAQDAGATSEVIRDGHTGRLVPIGDVDALSRAMLDILQSPERAASFGVAARLLVANRYDSRVRTQQLYDYYERLLAESRKIGPMRSTRIDRRPARSPRSRSSAELK